MGLVIMTVGGYWKNRADKVQLPNEHPTGTGW